MATKVSKSTIKTVATKASVTEYLNAISDSNRKKDCIVIKNIMQKITGKKPVMWGDSIVGFDTTVQTYSTGKQVDWMKMGFSCRKDAISLYLTCDLNEFERELKDLGKHKRGVGCLYIKTLADVDVKQLEKIFTKSNKRVK